MSGGSRRRTRKSGQRQRDHEMLHRLIIVERCRIDSRTRRARTCCSTRTTRSTGTPGATRRSRGPASEDRPILLSVGYSACHWCHVMEHESFEDGATAQLMNELFVNVKVDREERPDVDAIYMDAVQALTGHGGWPMTVFLTPDGEPFFAGTYYPPEPRHGLPSFRAGTARGRRRLPRAPRRGGAIGTSSSSRPFGARASSQPSARSARADASPRARARPAVAVRSALGRVRPRAEVPARIGARVPLYAASGSSTLDGHTTLDGMAAGGMYDHVGGGFHRYSVDERWLVPHFEKMLYDNALLAPVYLHAWVVTGEERYRLVAEESLDYLLRELSLPEGGFASAQDADTDGVEGLTFTWTPEELSQALGEERPELLEPFEHGRSVLRGELTEEERRRLFEVRERRPKPGRDDKAVASWNGLALAALAEAGRRLHRPDFTGAAVRLANFLLGPLSTHAGRLHRSFRAGQAKGNGYLEDYADVANGLYELHVATGELRWLEEAWRLALLAVELFADAERGGFFLAPADAEQLVVRKKELDDHPTPSGNSMLAFVLLRLARIYGDDELERHAVSVFRLVHRVFGRAPSAVGHGLVALDLHFSPPKEIAIVGTPQDEVARGARSFRAKRRRRLRAGRGGSVARGKDAGERATRRVRVRAFRLHCAGDGPERAARRLTEHRSLRARGRACISALRSTAFPGVEVGLAADIARSIAHVRWHERRLP